MRKRLDLWLVELNLARSRSLAQDLIEEGLVSVQGKIETKSSTEFQNLLLDSIEIRKGKANSYVSRGGLKLQDALEHTGFSPKDLVCLDLGISTGGFTDCLLQGGAKKVVGVDVGHGQLDESLKIDPRVVPFEGINARELNALHLGDHFPSGGFDLLVMDLSFISFTLVIGNAIQLLKPLGHIFILVKPQFEGDNDLTQIQRLVDEKGIQTLDYFKSETTGRDGTQEFFLFGTRRTAST